MHLPIRVAVLALTTFTSSSVVPQGNTANEIAEEAQRRAGAIAAATPAAPWGCVVLLCLANPSGPTAVAQCVEPIRALRNHLRARRPFPSCPMAQGPNGGARVRLGSDTHDPCPAGTTQLPNGQLAFSDNVTTYAAAAPSAPIKVSLLQPVSNATSSSSTGEGSSDAGRPGPRVCGSGYLGERFVGSGESAYSINVYQHLVLVPPSESANYIEVLIDRGDGGSYVVWTRTRY